MNKYIIIILNFLERITLKKNKIVFFSYPDYSDNAYALFKYLMAKNVNEKIELVWLAGGAPENIKGKIYDEFKVNLKVVKKRSMRGLWEYLTCKRIFLTHTDYKNWKTYNGEKKIYLWHGMPLKNVGNLSKKNSFSLEDYTISNSLFFKGIMSEAFGISEDKVLSVGQPRNDLMFEKTDFYKKVNIEKEKYGKIFAWLPTYRRGKHKNEKDSNFDITNQILTVEYLEKLNGVMEGKNNLLIIKLHPLDIANKEKFKEYSNIKIVKNTELEKMNVQLYPLLGSCDVLITDFSSVYIDYEILKRPILFFLPDIDEYRKARGLAIKIPLEKHLPGEIVYSKDELLEKLEQSSFKIIESPIKLNDYYDNKSSERLSKKLGLDL